MKSFYEWLFTLSSAVFLALVCYSDLAHPKPPAWLTIVMIPLGVIALCSAFLGWRCRRKLKNREQAPLTRTVTGMDFGSPDGEHTVFVRNGKPLRPMPVCKTPTYQFYDGLTCMRVGGTVLAWREMKEKRNTEDAGA